MEGVKGSNSLSRAIYLQRMVEFASNVIETGVWEQEIALEAYHLWQAAGRPEGRAVEHWLEAETRLRAARADTREARAPSVAAEATESGQARGVRYGLVLGG